MRLVLAGLLSATVLLSSCGGGSSAPPTPPTQTDIHEAEAAQLVSVANPTAGTLSLQWLDTFPPGATYSIESQGADGRFTTIDTLAGIGGQSAPMSWPHALAGLSVVRVQAHVEDRFLPIQTPSHAESLSIVLPGRLPTEVLDQFGPLTGTVNVSLDDRASYRAVAWLLNGNSFSTVSTPGAAIAWNTRSFAGSDPAHLSARLETSPDAWVETAGRDVTVSNSAILLSYSLHSGQGRTYVDFIAGSSSGGSIASVSAALDGGPPAVLHAPNACQAEGCNADGSYNAYEFAYDDATTPGKHALLATATDGTGLTQNLGVPFVIFPLTFTPPDGAIVDGTLKFSVAAVGGSGSAVFDAYLDDVPIASGATPPFAADVDLSSVKPGAHQLVVDVHDFTTQHVAETHTVVVASSPALVYTPVMTLGNRHGQMLAANADLLVYAADDGEHLRNVATGTDTLLSGSAAIVDAARWQVESGFVFAEGAGADCIGHCIYQWSADGTRTNITPSAPLGGWEWFVARFGSVLWSTSDLGTQTLTMYDIATATTSTINPQLTYGSIVSIDTELDLYDGSLHAYLVAGEMAYGIYDWSKATGQTNRLDAGNHHFSQLQSDGARLAWKDGGAGYYVPLAGGAAVTLVSSLYDQTIDLVARDGVITWRLPSDGRIRAMDSTGIVSQLQGSMLYGTSDGVVVSAGDSGLMTWNATASTTALRLDAQPNQVLFGGGSLYFTVGESSVVYRIPLH